MTKISKIVKQTKEYERLSRLIENIEKAVKDFDRVNEIKDNDIYADCNITLKGGTVFFVTTTGRHADVFLNSDVSELIREDMKAVLKKHLAKLKKQRNALEV